LSATTCPGPGKPAPGPLARSGATGDGSIGSAGGSRGRGSDPAEGAVRSDDGGNRGSDARGGGTGGGGTGFAIRDGVLGSDGSLGGGDGAGFAARDGAVGSLGGGDGAGFAARDGAVGSLGGGDGAGFAARDGAVGSLGGGAELAAGFAGRAGVLGSDGSLGGAGRGGRGRGGPETAMEPPYAFRGPAGTHGWRPRSRGTPCTLGPGRLACQRRLRP
jgi:hypothetical protein